MKILQSVQKYYTKLGLNAPDLFQKHPFNSRNVLNLFILGHFSISTAVSLLFEANTFSEYAESFYIACTVLVACLNFVVTLSKSRKLFKLIQNIDSAIQKRFENERSKEYYDIVNAQFEKGARILDFAFVNVTFPCITIPNFIMSFFLYFTTDAGSNAFKLPFPEWMPFACTNPLEYLIAFAIQCAGIFIVIRAAYCVVNLFVGLSAMLITYAKDIKEEMCIFQIGPTKEALGVKQKLAEFVELHANAKQLVRDFVDIFEYNILMFFLWSLTTICSSLLLVQMELQRTVLSLMLLAHICLAIWSFALIFFFCYFGENISGQFDELNDAIYQFDWYRCPIEIQRLIPTILIVTQNPPVFKVFGNVACTRGAFKMVANSGFSYFMVLREFGS